MRIGLCTGGGDCPGLNAAIRAVVKHAVGTYGMEVVGIRDSFNGLMEKPYGVKSLELNDVTEILARGGTILGTTNAGNPFKDESAESKAQVKAVLDAYKDLGLDAILVVGGDGTQTIGAQFSELGLNTVGIPKTIDNDLASTDLSIGFQTAVEVASDALDRLKSTAESHDRVMVLEVMGRDAGHIALHAGIASGANAILIPEIPFSYDPIVQKIKERKAMGRYFSIVVVAEGAYEKGGKPLFQEAKSAKYASANLGGIGGVVAEKLHQLADIDARITVLGHIQRGGSPVAYDRILASAFGVRAVDLVAEKTFGVVVGYREGRIAETPYAEVTGITQPLAQNSFFIKTAEGLGICLGR